MLLVMVLYARISWPGIDGDVTRLVKDCMHCQVRPASLHSVDIPIKLCTKVGLNIVGPINIALFHCSVTYLFLWTKLQRGLKLG